MNELKLISDYKHNEEYRLSFNELAQEVFGINFEPWYQQGGWSDRYICYSYVDSDKVVANVSINKMDLVWEGQAKKALQIGTVMTHPDYRGRGLGASLIKTVLAEHEENYDLVYLFGDASAVGFYRKAGFSEIEESQFTMTVTPSEANTDFPRQLDLNNATDRALFERLTSMRVPISQTLGAVNDQHLLLFYGLLAFANNIYYLEEQDALVIYRVKESTLHLFDVISTQAVPLESVLERILTPAVRLVHFHFTPELENGNVTCEPLQTEDALFVRPAIKVTKPFTFPYTSHA